MCIYIWCDELLFLETAESQGGSSNLYSLINTYMEEVLGKDLNVKSDEFDSTLLTEWAPGASNRTTQIISTQLDRHFNTSLLY